MYTTEPTLEQDCPTDPSQEWNPERAYDPCDILDTDAVLEYGHIWSAVNSVVEAIASGKLPMEDRARLTLALAEIPF